LEPPNFKGLNFFDIILQTSQTYKAQTCIHIIQKKNRLIKSDPKTQHSMYMLSRNHHLGNLKHNRHLEVDAVVAFPFFSATNCEWPPTTAVGFCDRGPVNTDARDDLPTVVATDGRIEPALPNRFRGISIGGIVGVKWGDESPAENSGGHAGMRSGAILAGGGENGGAGDAGRWYCAGGVAGRRELNLLGPSWAGRKYERVASRFRDHSLFFLFL
jgi:uncharacterized membrane protein YgcG